MKKLLLALVLTALLVLSYPAIAFAAQPGSPAGATDFAPDRILVQFRPGAGLPEVAQVHRQMNGRVKDSITGIGVQVVEVGRGQAVARARAYAAHPLVEYAEPDFVVEATGDPNDPWFANQWGMTRVQAPEAWDVTTGGSSIRIAILDTGVDLNHPDLAAKIVSSRNFTTSATADDIQGHGTHVAGIAAAITNNGVGVAGLGYDSTIMNVKVLGDDGRGYYSWISQGITWAADNGAQVINMSLSGASASSTLESAVNYAWNRGVMVIAAAGNYGDSVPRYPAYYENCLAVAATDSRDNLTSWSNRGDWVDVAAPGSTIYSTLRTSGYGYKSGTSMAAPHVAGLAALTFTVVTDDNGSGRLNDEVRARIEAGCDDIGVSGIGAGRINALNSVAGGSAPPPPPPPPAAGSITGRVTDRADGTPVAGASVSSGSIHVKTNHSGEYRIEDLPEGSYTVDVSAAGYAAVSRSVNVAAGATSVADFALEPLPPTTGSIRGRVTDAADGSPIAGASVSLKGVSATTDSKGEYRITDLSEGAEVITVSAAGYADLSQTVEIIAGEVSEVNFGLDRLPPPAPGDMWVDSVSFSVRGVNLNITVQAMDAAGALPGVQTELTVTNGGQNWCFAGVTDNSGRVVFTIQKGPQGTYVATVSGLSADGYEWDTASGVISAEYTVVGKTPKK